jgi:hypothetical protein
VGRPDDVARLTKQGRTPSQIAADLGGLNINSVKGYLSRAIGEGHMRMSDVFFALQDQAGTQIEPFLRENPGASFWEIRNHVHEHGSQLEWDDLQLYLQLRAQGVAWGDLYAMLAQLERTIHARVRVALIERFGPDEKQWWDKGVPEQIREHCERRRSESREQPLLSPYYYTTFPNLIDIIDNQWPLLEPHLPPSLAYSKGAMKDCLHQVNRIRNRAMHPVRSAPPTKSELEFVRHVSEQFAGPRVILVDEV